MRAPAQTKIFGIQLAIDPKWLVGGLIALAAVLFWFNSRSDEHPSTSSSATRTQATAANSAMPLQSRTRTPRRPANSGAERGTLRIKAVDASTGQVDPTLRLYLLARLQSIEIAPAGRSLFEAGPTPEQVAAAQHPIQGPIVPVNTPPVNQAPAAPIEPVTPVANIPLKFYGFVNPASKKETNRGLFLDGDNILVAAEGDLLDHKYLVVELTANSARMEDVQMKQGQTLPVVPEATQQ